LILAVTPGSPNSRGWARKRLRRDLESSGIIRALTAECGRNVCDAGLDAITAAHTQASERNPDVIGEDAKVIFDLDWTLGWYGATGIRCG
jgi:hypothetical protein